MFILLKLYLNSFLLTFFVEMLGRQSFMKAFSFLKKSPINFSCNMFIIALTLCIALLAPTRRRFIQALVSPGLCILDLPGHGKLCDPFLQDDAVFS